MTEAEKRNLMDKVLQYGTKMTQGKYISAQRIYSDIERSIKTDKEDFLERLNR